MLGNVDLRLLCLMIDVDCKARSDGKGGYESGVINAL